LGGRLLFLFVSDRGVSCLRQHHHNARKAVMDWNQVRDYLEDDEVSGLSGPSGFLRPQQLPKQLILHGIDIGHVTADLVGDDDRAGLAFPEKLDYLLFLVRFRACYVGTPCGR